jgi:hypothetical protein
MRVKAHVGPHITRHSQTVEVSVDIYMPHVER